MKYMDSKFKRQIVAEAETIKQLAQKICGGAEGNEKGAGRD